MNRIVLLVILNAVIGIFLKIFPNVRPLYTIYFQLWLLLKYGNTLEYRLNGFYFDGTCQHNYICGTIDTLGRNFMLVNLTIPLFFFYKFDLRFNECLKCLIENLKKKLKKKKPKKVRFSDILILKTFYF